MAQQRHVNDSYAEWFRLIKQELLVSEPQNIAARAQCCTNIINESITHLNMQLGLNQLSNHEHYSCALNPSEHLKFLCDWPGLRIGTDLSKAPKTKREYEKKAKNWLNGRRAPNYGRTLFPYFIYETEKYVEKVSKYLVPNDVTKQSLYYKILIFKILAQLCGCSVSLNEQAKKAPFFCKNSIERKGKLKELLQSYASDHQYIQGFPSCFEEAIDYFENKSNSYFAKYRQQYMRKTMKKEYSANSGYQTSSTNSTKIDDDGDTVFDEDEEDLTNHPKQEQKQQHQTSNLEIEFWKNKCLHLNKQLESERNQRINAQNERDQLKLLFNVLMNSNTQQIPVPQPQPQPQQSPMFSIIPNDLNNLNNFSVNQQHLIPIQYGVIATPSQQTQHNVPQQPQQRVQQHTNHNNRNTNITDSVQTMISTPNNNAFSGNGGVSTLSAIPTIPTFPTMTPIHLTQNATFVNATNNNNFTNNQLGEQMAKSLMKYLETGANGQDFVNNK